ncbi:MAG: hypothetical protein ACOCTT_01655 [archaeon]
MSERNNYNLTENQEREIKETGKKAFEAQQFPDDCKHLRSKGELETKILITMVKELGLPFEKAKVTVYAVRKMQKETGRLRNREGLMDSTVERSSCGIGRGCLDWEKEHLDVDRSRSDSSEYKLEDRPIDDRKEG